MNIGYDNHGANWPLRIVRGLPLTFTATYGTDQSAATLVAGIYTTGPDPTLVQTLAPTAGGVGNTIVTFTLSAVNSALLTEDDYVFSYTTDEVEHLSGDVEVSPIGQPRAGTGQASTITVNSATITVQAVGAGGTIDASQIVTTGYAGSPLETAVEASAGSVLAAGTVDADQVTSTGYTGSALETLVEGSALSVIDGLDTGWLDASSLLTSGWALDSPGTGANDGRILLRRIGDFSMMNISRLVPDAATAVDVLSPLLSAGFRPTWNLLPAGMFLGASAGDPTNVVNKTPVAAFVSQSGNLRLDSAQTGGYYGFIMWDSSATPFPTGL